MLALFLFTLAVIARFVVHVPNFTPILAVALFSGVYMKKKYAVILPLAVMALTDVFLGAHSVMFFTWGSIAAIAIIGLWVRDNKNVKTIVGSSLFSAILFFVISNLGVWLVAGIYPLTFAGLAKCFTMAIPFFRTTLLSTIVYSAVLFGTYEFLAVRLKNTQFASVL